eukprot:755976-Hanusia_phi.AAC.5
MKRRVSASFPREALVMPCPQIAPAMAQHAVSLPAPFFFFPGSAPSCQSNAPLPSTAPPP